MCLLSRAWASTSFISFNPSLPRQYFGPPLRANANALRVQKHNEGRRLSRSSSIVEQCPIRRRASATRIAAASATAATSVAAAEDVVAATTVPLPTAGRATGLPSVAGGTPSTTVVEILTSLLGDLSARQLRLIVDSPAYREIEPKLQAAGGDDAAGRTDTDVQLRELLEAVLEAVGGRDERACAIKVVVGCPALLLWDARELRARVQELQDAASILLVLYSVLCYVVIRIILILVSSVLVACMHV